MELDNPTIASAVQQPEPSEPLTQEEFNGVFYFTNATNEDFRARWNNVEYLFPANKTSPLIIPTETSLGIQSIRKKFARELAEREFYKTPKFAYMNDRERGERPALYTEADLEPFIQTCLKPLPVAIAKAQVVRDPRINDEVFSTDEDGDPRTRVLKSKASGDGKDDSLVGNGSVVA